MSHSRLLILAAIFIVVILAGFALSVPHTREVPAEKSPTEATTTPTVTLHDTYKKGVHTLSGSVLAPDACTPVSADASIVGTASTTDGIALELSMPIDSGICLRIPTRVSFSTTIVASANASISITVNGVAASTTPL